MANNNNTVFFVKTFFHKFACRLFYQSVLIDYNYMAKNLLLALK